VRAQSELPAHVALTMIINGQNVQKHDTFF
jgi:hypothetical protein